MMLETRSLFVCAALLLAAGCSSTSAPASVDSGVADRGVARDSPTPADRGADSSAADSAADQAPPPDVRVDLADASDDAVAADLSTIPKVKGVWAVGHGGTIITNVSGSWQTQPSGSSRLLNGVWGTASNDIWAVGQGGTVLHYDGASWRPVPSGVTDTLLAVWGHRHDDVWIGGVQWINNKASALFLHWDGKRVSRVSSAGIVTKYQSGVSYLWGSAADDVWAMTASALLMHWDGKAWTYDPSWAIGGVAGGIWGASAHDVWVAQSDAVYHWDGKTWTPTQKINNLGAIWGTAANNIWVSTKLGSLCHYTGSWDCNTPKVSRFVGAPWNAMSGRAADDIYALTNSPKSALAHFDGTLWTVTTTQYAYLADIWATP